MVTAKPMVTAMGGIITAMLERLPSNTGPDPAGMAPPAALQRLLAWLSPAFPVGAYTYSHGLEWAIEDGTVVTAADLDVLQQRLGDGPWLFGRRPTAADAAVVPVLSALDKLPGDTPARQGLRARDSLMAYVARGRAQLYPERFRTPISAAA